MWLLQKGQSSARGHLSLGLVLQAGCDTSSTVSFTGKRITFLNEALGALLASGSWSALPPSQRAPQQGWLQHTSPVLQHPR